MTDKQKIIKIAELFGDNYRESKKSVTVKPWGRRFTFNEAEEIVKIQDVFYQESGKVYYKVIGRV